MRFYTDDAFKYMGKLRARVAEDLTNSDW